MADVEVAKGVEVVGPGLCENRLGINDCGRRPHLLPVSLVIDPVILLGLFDRLFCHLDLRFCLMEEEERIFHFQCDLIPEIGQDVLRLFLPALTVSHAVLCFSPLPEIPVRQSHDSPVFLRFVCAPRQTRRVSVSGVVADKTDARIVFALQERDDAARQLGGAVESPDCFCQAAA